MDWLLALAVLLVVAFVVVAFVVVRRRSGPSEVGESDAALRSARRDAQAHLDDPDAREWDRGTH